MANFTHHIKARKLGKRQWSFVSPRNGGSVNHLRVHASLYTEETASLALPELQAGNPEWEFRIVRIDRGGQLCSTCGKICRRTLNMCPTCYPVAKPLRAVEA